LNKLGGFVYVKRIDEHFITLEHMREKTLQACGLQEILTQHEEHPQYYLVRSLPTAEFLNSQSAVQEFVDAGERAREFLGADESDNESEEELEDEAEEEQEDEPEDASEHAPEGGTRQPEGV
jgi:hypothetical protein